MNFRGTIEFALMDVGDVATAEAALSSATLLLFKAGSDANECRGRLEAADREAVAAYTADDMGETREFLMGRWSEG